MGDCMGSYAYEISCADYWGKHVAIDVQKHFLAGRKLVVVGHSLGGHSAVIAAQHVTGVTAFVALHPAWELSSNIGPSIRGPILFTTGTADDGVYAGLTLPSKAKW